MDRFLLLLFICMGNIIPYLSAKAENKTVVEGRYWNYGFHRNYELIELKGFHFKGTIEINNHTYSIFRDKDETEVAYMREKNNCVYLYCGEKAPTDFIIDLPYPVFDDELTIYDFGLPNNRIFETLSFGESDSYHYTWQPQIMECYVINTEFLNGDERFRKIDFRILREIDMSSEYSIHYFIEGIGCMDGFLSFPCIEYIKTAGFADTPICLLNVEDDQGNIIFNRGMLSEIFEVSNENIQSGSSPIFNLHGCEVSNPLPGSIYIRNGKKFVAK